MLSDSLCAKRVMSENSAQAGKTAFIANLSNATGNLIKSHVCFQEYYDAPSTATSTWAEDNKKLVILYPLHRLSARRGTPNKTSQ